MLLHTRNGETSRQKFFGRQLSSHVPKLLDLYCCQGGAAAGYAKAGFDVTGVDLKPQRRFPFTFHQADALEYARQHGHQYDAIHASPPCQAHSNCQRIRDNEHPDLIADTREVLEHLGLPYVIENVVGAPLRDPALLCGHSLGLHTFRHRLFETNWPYTPPPHAQHPGTTVKMGRALQPGDYYHAVGNFISVDYVREDMQVPWMSRHGIRECIPPAYTLHIGEQLHLWMQAPGHTVVPPPADSNGHLLLW
jgi:DNA (cytosine-5)-methyltransferase 1